MSKETDDFEAPPKSDNTGAKVLGVLVGGSLLAAFVLLGVQAFGGKKKKR